MSGFKTLGLLKIHNNQSSEMCNHIMQHNKHDREEKKQRSKVVVQHNNVCR